MMIAVDGTSHGGSVRTMVLLHGEPVAHLRHVAQTATRCARRRLPLVVNALGRSEDAAQRCIGPTHP
jgi:hypothetical protein